MDAKTLERFLKIANMMMDEHEGVRSQALVRCNTMLAEHRLHWRDVISISTRPNIPPIQPSKPSSARNTYENLKRKQSSSKTQQKTKTNNVYIMGDNIPSYIVGKIHVLLKYTGSKKNFIDVLVVEEDDDLINTYGPIRLFDQNSRDVINDIAEGQDSFTYFSISVKPSKNIKYHPTGKILS